MSGTAGLRAALYWSPHPADPLFEAGSTWLGRDAERAVAVPQPDVPGIAALTQAPSVYGFHATLRPPMRLATGWSDFIEAAQKVAESIQPFELPALQVDELDGFLALRECTPCPALRQLADACVRGTNRHRLAASSAELAKRRAIGLSAEQDELLLQWGYPYVMQAWRFHMTLSRRLDAAAMGILRPAAEAHFAAALAVPRQVREIAVFTQLGQAPFLIAAWLKLG